MLITATNKPVVVRFKDPNKSYASNGGEQDQANVGPFDEKRIEVGESFETGDAAIVGAAELEG
jgi:hypothetical protein